MARPKAKSAKPQQQQASKRTYLKQSDVPSASLDEAMRISQAIFEHYAGKATSPLHVAKALNIDPSGSQLKVLSGASIAFGLTEGGAQAASIAVTDLARRILRPVSENADVDARREAVLKPRIFGEFLREYDANPFPREDIALNVLEGKGVPREKTAEVLERILTSASSVGFIEEIKGKKYVSLQGIAPIPETSSESDESQDSQIANDPPLTTSSSPDSKTTKPIPVTGLHPVWMTPA
jgi:hypothetical protein